MSLSLRVSLDCFPFKNLNNITPLTFVEMESIFFQVGEWLEQQTFSSDVSANRESEIRGYPGLALTLASIHTGLTFYYSFIGRERERENSVTSLCKGPCPRALPQALPLNVVPLDFSVWKGEDIFIRCTHGSSSECLLLLFNSVEGNMPGAMWTDECVIVTAAISNFCCSH